MGIKQEQAQRESRTVFRNTVVDVPLEPRLSKLKVPLYALTWAGGNRKIGGWMEKGRPNWIGRPIFSLTLEERATCPRTCQQWRSCYGDNMHLARRMRHGPGLEAAIEIDLTHLDAAFPDGYLVRLHVLGDFYSVGYCRFWERMLREHACLLYGYTHRQHDTSIGRAVAGLALRNPERVSMMRSEPTAAGDPLPAAWVVDRKAERAVPGSVLCPQETGRTESCGTCGLCMNGRTSVSFLNHSHAAVNAASWERRRALTAREETC